MKIRIFIIEKVRINIAAINVIAQALIKKEF